MRRRFHILLILGLVLSGCRGEGEVEFSKRVRYASDQGVVTQIDFASVKLDGQRGYSIRKDVQSFSTYNGKVTALLSWKDKYVHIGVDDDRNVLWVAGIGVLDRSVDPPLVYYSNGLLKRVDGKRRAIFADGTVLQLDREVEIPPSNSRLTAAIDSVRHIVLELRSTVE